jgi:hypothetical protein
MITLTWTPYIVGGKTLWQLNAGAGFASPLRTGARAGGIGHVGWQERHIWRAEAQIGVTPEYMMFFLAGSFHAAREALERELCRRSIGWFGEDDIEFVYRNG